MERIRVEFLRILNEAENLGWLHSDDMCWIEIFFKYYSSVKLLDLKKCASLGYGCKLLGTDLISKIQNANKKKALSKNPPSTRFFSSIKAAFPSFHDTRSLITHNFCWQKHL